MIVVAIVALMVITAVPALANGSDQRPYKGVEHGMTVVDFASCDDSEFPKVSCPITTESVANFTHLGKTVGAGSGTAVLDFGSPCDGAGSATVTNTGEAVFTAANGDELHVDYNNTLCFSTNDSPIEGTQTITGGTGRFDGASGSAIVTGTSFTDGTFKLSPNGRIDY